MTVPRHTPLYKQRVRSVGEMIPVNRPVRAWDSGWLRALREADVAALAARPMVTSCLFCDFRFEGATDECRVEWEAHLAARHPEIAARPKKKRNRPLAVQVADRLAKREQAA